VDKLAAGQAHGSTVASASHAAAGSANATVKGRAASIRRAGKKKKRSSKWRVVHGRGATATTLLKGQAQ
jgi:hypothetical protein